LDTTGQATGTIQLGIVIGDSRIAWGTCEDVQVGDRPDFQSPFSIEEGIAFIEEKINPLLVGQKLVTFRHLASVVESIRETVTISKPVPQPERRSQIVSRRAIISGFLSSSEADESVAATEQITIERAIHPAIGHGLSQALLSAVSMVRGVTVAEIIAEEFDLPIPSTAVDLQMPIQRGQKLQLHDQISALSYAVGRTDFEESLGPNGERIQRFVRQLRESLVEAGYARPMTIHLDTAGGLGQIFGQDIGKVLGALYGLEQAAKPCLVRVQDPLILDDLDSQIEALGQLRSYIRMRGMSLQLVASAGIHTLSDIRSFVQAEAVHVLHLQMSRLGTIQELIVASQECRARDMRILLEGAPSAVTSQVALAMQPDLLTYPRDRPAGASIAAFHNEMARTLTWLTQKAT
jgi:methylaspartate ammonia-lyase